MSNQMIEITALIMTIHMQIVHPTQMEEIGVKSEKETTSMTAVVIQLVAHMVVATGAMTAAAREFATVAFRVV